MNAPSSTMTRLDMSLGSSSYKPPDFMTLFLLIVRRRKAERRTDGMGRRRAARAVEQVRPRHYQQF